MSDDESGVPDPDPTEFDDRRQCPSIAVVEAVAAVKDADPLALEPLGAVVDTDALDELLRSTGTDGRIETSFTYENCRIVALSEGIVDVEPLASGCDTETTE